jgi:hypothetical protein
MEIHFLKLIKRGLLIAAFIIFFNLNEQNIVLADSSSLVFDRGLPTANLNLNADGDPTNDINRSNDSLFSRVSDNIIGDDFTIGSPGETWIIDKIQVWSHLGGDPIVGTPNSLGDEFINLKLYGGKASDLLTERLGGNFTSGDVLDNPNIILKRVKYNNGQDFYQTYGSMWLPLYEIDFQNLNWQVEGGVKYHFGVNGIGRIGEDGGHWSWVSHASNKDLSGFRQDGADDFIRVWADATAPVEIINTYTIGISEKPFDINVRIWAHKFQKADQRCRTISNRLFSKEFCFPIIKKPVIIRPKELDSEKITNMGAIKNTNLHTGSLYINKVSD